MLFSSPRWDSVVYWSLDLETGGRGSTAEAILALAMVPLRAGQIQVGDAYRTVVQPEHGAAPDAGLVRAHQLAWGELGALPTLAEASREVAARVAGSVLIVHQRAVELASLRRAFERQGVPWTRPPVVDTVDLLSAAARRDRFRGVARVDLPTLSLTRARRRYGLPEYQAGDALTGAVAVAELFLVLRNVLGARTLRHLRATR